MEEKAWELPSLGGFPICTPRGLGKGGGVKTLTEAALIPQFTALLVLQPHVPDSQPDRCGRLWVGGAWRPAALPLPTWLPWGVWAAKWAPHVPSVN